MATLTYDQYIAVVRRILTEVHRALQNENDMVMQLSILSGWSRVSEVNLETLMVTLISEPMNIPHREVWDPGRDFYNPSSLDSLVDSFQCFWVFRGGPMLSDDAIKGLIEWEAER